MHDRYRRYSMIAAVIGGPLVTFAAAALLVPDIRSILRNHDLPIVLIVVFVSVVIYQVAMAIFKRMTGDSDPE